MENASPHAALPPNRFRYVVTSFLLGFKRGDYFENRSLTASQESTMEITRDLVFGVMAVQKSLIDPIQLARAMAMHFKDGRALP